MFGASAELELVSCLELDDIRYSLYFTHPWKQHYQWNTLKQQTESFGDIGLLMHPNMRSCVRACQVRFSSQSDSPCVRDTYDELQYSTLGHEESFGLVLCKWNSV